MTELEWEQIRNREDGAQKVQVRLPSDGLNAVDLWGRNGPCRVYRLGRPMDAGAFLAMPGDLQTMYLKKLRQRGADEEGVRQMLGVSADKLTQLRKASHVTFDLPDRAAWTGFLEQ